MTALDLTLARAALRDFTRTWPQLLVLSLATRMAVALLLVPGLALALRLALLSQGRSALSDEEILFFFLSPVGITTLIVIGGASVGVSLIEQAGLMTIGFGSAEDRRISWHAALRYIGTELPTIIALGAHLLARVLVLTLPILALIGGVYQVFLRAHDINYYLLNWPPEFLWAAGTAAILIAGLALLLVSRILSWMYALPAVLFEHLGAAAALRDSVTDSRGHRWELFRWILAWIGLAWIASIGLTWLVGITGRLVVPQASQSVSLVALTIGAVGLLSILVNLALSFLSASAFSLLIVRLYRLRSGPGRLPGHFTDTGPLGPRAAVRVPAKGLLWVGAGVATAAIVVAATLVSGVKAEDSTIVIAHRGAALHAPENTMASIRRAMDDEADYIEIDVQESADGEVVVFHDSDFMKTAGQPLKLWEAKREDLAALDIGSWYDPAFAEERVPTLEEVLLAARGRAKVNIELKYYGQDEDLERRVVDIVERTGMESDVVVMSLKYDKVRKIKSMRPDWTYGLLTTVNLGDPTRFAADFLAVNVKTASRGFVRRAHRAGREVYVWTVNDPFTMSAMMSRGVDGIITDDPGLARRVLELRSELSPAERILVGIGTEIGVFSMPGPPAREGDA